MATGTPLRLSSFLLQSRGAHRSLELLLQATTRSDTQRCVPCQLVMIGDVLELASRICLPYGRFGILVHLWVVFDRGDQRSMFGFLHHLLRMEYGNLLPWLMSLQAILRSNLYLCHSEI